MRQINLEQVKVFLVTLQFRKVVQKLADGVLQTVIALGKLEVFYKQYRLGIKIMLKTDV